METVGYISYLIHSPDRPTLRQSSQLSWLSKRNRLVTREPKLYEPFPIDPLSHLLKTFDASVVVLDETVIRPQDRSDLPLSRDVWQSDHHAPLIAQVHVVGHVCAPLHRISLQSKLATLEPVTEK